MTISIITATYNSSSTIRDTFESVLRQEYQNIEYIVIDGGSTDGTIEIIKQYEPKFNGRMKWISEPDKGIYDAMNKGICKASGEIVGILNSDDFYSSDNILSVVAQQFSQDSTIDAIYGDIIYVDWNDTTRILRHYSSKHFKREYMKMGFMPAHPSFYCKRTTYNSFQLQEKENEYAGYAHPLFFNPTYKIAADFENLLRMVYVGRINTKYIRRNFVTMRTGGASSSGYASHKQINKDHMRAFKENGVNSNYFLIALRYLYKVIELVEGRIISI